MSEDLTRLAMSLGRIDGIVKQARGVTAKTVNEVRDTAIEIALSTWTEYGRGMAGSAGEIDARMSKDRDLVEGYVMVRGVGGIMQERGTSRHPPQPVLQPAMERHIDEYTERLAEVGARILR